MTDASGTTNYLSCDNRDRLKINVRGDSYRLREKCDAKAMLPTRSLISGVVANLGTKRRRRQPAFAVCHLDGRLFIKDTVQFLTQFCHA
jgi:hypothetical protein